MAACTKKIIFATSNTTSRDNNLYSLYELQIIC
nr:MAG TPA: hypothetical protein [Caudoviricetes sp.]DAK04741.1 MAG TPA: hypothetical protein [Caudoviricetes sp.]DAL06153.1 MAG TPA: hypothetical protein [Caudoviricetes sp.]DAL90871.1 MAG TPA: hypothetical protein [Caudoviricetes sp.]DAM18377.1 MAG TPA: hypothetical protein [Caudoviricetes sp.]